MEEESDTLMRFGAFELDLGSRELRRGASCVRLQTQPFEILRLLLARRGSVVTRDELRARLWPAGTFVDFDHSLNAAVKRLRTALDDHAEDPRYVETVPRRGYRFIGHREPAIERNGNERVRLAILPFIDRSDDGDSGFSDGLAEETIAQLGRLCRRIGIISLRSSMTFKGALASAGEIGRSLRADYLLEGSALRSGDRVRVSARLIETASETHMWVDSYDQAVTDRLSAQTDVATRIAQSLTHVLQVPPVSAGSASM
jgi:TolB-like protein